MNCRPTVIKKDMKGNKMFCYSLISQKNKGAYVVCVDKMCAERWMRAGGRLHKWTKSVAHSSYRQRLCGRFCGGRGSRNVYAASEYIAKLLFCNRPLCVSVCMMRASVFFSFTDFFFCATHFIHSLVHFVPLLCMRCVRAFFFISFSFNNQFQFPRQSANFFAWAHFKADEYFSFVSTARAPCSCVLFQSCFVLIATKYAYRRLHDNRTISFVLFIYINFRFLCTVIFVRRMCQHTVRNVQSRSVRSLVFPSEFLSLCVELLNSLFFSSALFGNEFIANTSQWRRMTLDGGGFGLLQWIVLMQPAIEMTINYNRSIDVFSHRPSWNMINITIFKYSLTVRFYSKHNNCTSDRMKRTNVPSSIQ